MLDLVVLERDRHGGAIAVLLCDDDARLRVPVVVGDIPPGLTLAERTRSPRA
ncbi:hypothetical protein [Aquipuribacter nitratireducens]|uniref:Uncharacterized protein n=1 Tax=Aquipuribacter nitratireducens TaxID=650104 RepID=A0ABW0GH84_9MICO